MEYKVPQKINQLKFIDCLNQEPISAPGHKEHLASVDCLYTLLSKFTKAHDHHYSFMDSINALVRFCGLPQLIKSKSTKILNLRSHLVIARDLANG